MAICAAGVVSHDTCPKSLIHVFVSRPAAVYYRNEVQRQCTAVPVSVLVECMGSEFSNQRQQGHCHILYIMPYIVTVGVIETIDKMRALRGTGS